MTHARSSGVLLHPRSLPGGRLGEEAYRFVDWLSAAGQTWWQILPLGPPDEEGSPYKAKSAFACWPELLADPSAPVSDAEVESFAERHAFWAPDWAAFAGAGALADQVRFEREWGALRAYAAAKGVRLFGDVPIYVAAGSADHLSHPELFQRGLVAGVPPDAWSDVGQLWGNPLYDWPALRATGYRWWIERLRRTLQLVQLARVDHFRGFVSYWAVPEGAPTAMEGTWRRGPGRDLFDTARAELAKLELERAGFAGAGPAATPLPLVAEDLGAITPAVLRLRDELGLPGTVVLQFLLPDGGDPLTVPERRVVYTGTHDNDTSAGWWTGAPPEARSRALQAAREAGISERDPAWLMIRLALASPAQIAIIPAQDLLSLGSGARMNTPGTVGGNWKFELAAGALDAGLAARLRAATEAAGRT